MANETTTTTISSVINSSYIEPLMLKYAIDAAVALPFLRVSNVMGKGTKTAQFAVVAKDSASSLTEATDPSNVTLDYTAVTVAIGEVGIVRDVTKMALRTNIIGEAELLSFIVEEGSTLCVEKMETDVWAIFGSASTSVGTSGAAFTLANFAAGLSQLGINKARGRAVCMLSGKQASDLRDAVIASSAAVLANGAAANVLSQVGDDGVVGELFGCPIYMSNLAATSGADKIGCFMINGAAYPQNAPIGMALGWMPEAEQLGNPSLRSMEIAVTCAYGVAEISDFNYVKIVTRGS